MLWKGCHYAYYSRLSLTLLLLRGFPHPHGGNDFTVFNGPDEQFVSGRLIGADGGIGGTYAVMSELFIKADLFVQSGENEKARDIQTDIDRIIYKMCSAKGNLYAVMKEIIKRREGLDLGSVRLPLAPLYPEDESVVVESIELIDKAISKWV